MKGWRWDDDMNDKNYFGMRKWLRTDGMTSEWWNNIVMTLWHQNDSGMMEPHQSDGELTRRSTIIYVVTLSTERAKKGNVYRCRVVSFQGTSFRGGTTQQGRSVTMKFNFNSIFYVRYKSEEISPRERCAERPSAGKPKLSGVSSGYGGRSHWVRSVLLKMRV